MKLLIQFKITKVVTVLGV